MAVGWLGEEQALLWPDRCVLCQRPVARGAICCARCRRETPLVDRPLRRGGLPVAAVWRYAGRVPSAVARFKFYGEMETGRQMAKLMARAWEELCPGFGAECVAFVPVPRERERQRGYNQAQLLAEWAGAELGLPVAGVLRRDGVLMQHHLSAVSRKKGTRTAFRMIEGMEGAVEGRRVLLVDDVVTTGGTVKSCAQQLWGAGAEAVAVLAAAVVEK